MANGMDFMPRILADRPPLPQARRARGLTCSRQQGDAAATLEGVGEEDGRFGLAGLAHGELEAEHARVGGAADVGDKPRPVGRCRSCHGTLPCRKRNKPKSQIRRTVIGDNDQICAGPNGGGMHQVERSTQSFMLACAHLVSSDAGPFPHVSYMSWEA